MSYDQEREHYESLASQSEINRERYTGDPAMDPNILNAADAAAWKLEEVFRQEWEEDFGELHRFDAAERLGELDEHGNPRPSPYGLSDEGYATGQDYIMLRNILKDLDEVEEAEFVEMSGLSTCPNCGEVWTEEEFAQSLFMNEDWIVLVKGSHYCPLCYPGDLS